MWVKPRGVFMRSRHREAQRLAAAGHVDDGKAGGREAARGAIALFAGLELVLAGAERGGAAPVQRFVASLERTVLGIDGLGEAEDLFGLAGDIWVQAFAGIDAIPA